MTGFITGADDGPGNGLGTGGGRLHEWLGDPVSEHPHVAPPGVSGQVFAEAMATGAVVVGRKTFDYAGHWGGDHHGVPIFVPARGTSPEPRSGWVHYVPDVLMPGLDGPHRRARSYDAKTGSAGSGRHDGCRCGRPHPAPKVRPAVPPAFAGGEHEPTPPHEARRLE